MTNITIVIFVVYIKTYNSYIFWSDDRSRLPVIIDRYICVQNVNNMNAEYITKLLKNNRKLTVSAAVILNKNKSNYIYSELFHKNITSEIIFIDY